MQIFLIYLPAFWKKFFLPQAKTRKSFFIHLYTSFQAIFSSSAIVPRVSLPRCLGVLRNALRIMRRPLFPQCCHTYVVSTVVQNKMKSDTLSCYNAIQSTSQHMWILISFYVIPCNQKIDCFNNTVVKQWAKFSHPTEAYRVYPIYAVITGPFLTHTREIKQNLAHSPKGKMFWDIFCPANSSSPWWRIG